MAKRILKTSVYLRLRTSNLKSQRGFTLIEMVIAIAITAILATGLVMATLLVFSANSSVVNHVLAIKQVQNAVDYISRDAYQAQTATSPHIPYQWNTPSYTVLTFTIPTSDGITYSYQTVVYQLSNSGTLTRNNQIIATNIPPGGFTGGNNYASITATVTGYRTETESRVVLLEP